MRAVLGLTVLAAAAIALAWWVAGLPGTVSATIGDTTLSTSSPVALVLLALLFLVLYFAVRALAALTRVPRAARRSRMRRNRIRGNHAVTRALVALAASDPDAAQREAGRSRRLLGDTPLTLLLTAQADRQAGQEDAAAATFRQLAGRKDAAFLGLRGLMRQATAREDWAGAEELARQAEAVRPGARWLQEERRTLALRTGNWADALRLSGPNLRAPLAVAAAETERDPATALRYAKQAWTANPSLAPAAIAYANRLRAVGKDSKGNEVLRRSWATQPHPDVATAYLGDLSDKQDRLRAANGLAQQNANHPESHLLQAQAALDAGMTKDALRHIKAVRAAGLNQRRVWVLLADIADQEGHGNEAQDALRHVAAADPDPFWRCAACGTAHGRWQPVCDACNTPGEINWVQPSQDAVARQVPLLDHADSGGGSLSPI
jgi:HemY protein